MHGLLMTDLEQQEIEYLIKREMEEILFDIGDKRLDGMIKQAMQDRYEVLFNLFKRFASKGECVQYMPSKKKGTYRN
ncbi:hypothetical protein [Thalassobacillus sp. CUG 92003]|uniref:hypothetical protein n=1 Tax=Thalassobacillus sp. CUG 92003 TaxID=2736641 RepID=UPI0015E64CFE|nr:hypothetical protein [Thalassobacillus sp. CUG 92003]